MPRLKDSTFMTCTWPFEMADQPPPGTDSEKTLLPGEAEIPSSPPQDAHSAYPPPSSTASVQPPYLPSAQPAPYPPPGAADGPPAAGTGYPASAPSVSVPPAVSYFERFLRSIHYFAHTTSTVRWFVGTPELRSLVQLYSRTTNRRRPFL